MIEVVRTSETSVYSNETTRHFFPEGSNLHVRVSLPTKQWRGTRLYRPLLVILKLNFRLFIVLMPVSPSKFSFHRLIGNTAKSVTRGLKLLR
jgi:hypothetical protein